MCNYWDVRHQMQSGDIIFFKPKKIWGWGKLVSWWTKSELVHCGLIIRFGGRILLLEASETGQVRLMPLSKEKRGFLWMTLKMSSTEVWTEKLEEVAMDHIGQKYDYLGALFAAFKRQRKNGRYYCSELVLDILQAAGLILRRNAFYTPVDIYNYLTNNLKITGRWVSFK